MEIKEQCWSSFKDRMSSIGNHKGIKFFREIGPDLHRKNYKSWFHKWRHNLDRETIRVISRIRANHYNLRESLARKNFISCGKCDCDQADEDIYHVIFDCGLYNQERSLIWEKMEKEIELVAKSVIELIKLNNRAPGLGDQVINGMRRSTEKQRSVAIPIKNGMEHLAECVDAQLSTSSYAGQPRYSHAASPYIRASRSAGQRTQEAATTRDLLTRGGRRRKKKKGKGTEGKEPSRSTPKGVPTSTPKATLKSAPKAALGAGDKSTPKKPGSTPGKVGTDKPGAPPPKPAKNKKRRTRKRRRRLKRSAVVMQPAAGKSYADVLGKIRRQVRPEETETELRQIRKTQRGGVLVELARCKDQRALQEAIKAAVGEDAEVRALVPRMRVEICDLDCCTTGEEVRAPVAQTLGDQLKGELKVAIEEAVSIRLIARNRIKIGWINCRVRRCVEVTKCFKCLGYGHTKRDCKGPDRSNACWRCGKDRHKSNDCTSPPRCMLCADLGVQQLDHAPRSGACKAFRDVLVPGNERRNGDGDPRKPEPQPGRRQPPHSAVLGRWALTWWWCASSTETGTARRGKLDDLEDALRDMDGGLVVTSDFNARAPEWGIPTPNARGKLVMEMASRLGLIVLNTGTTPTYRRPGFGVSIPDVTLVSECLGRRTTGWRVLEDFTGSDHQYITFRISSDGSAQHGRSRRPLGWNTAKRDEGKFSECMSRGLRGIPPAPREHPGRDVAEAMTVERPSPGVLVDGPGTSQVWTGTSLRRECLKLRRLAQRAPRRTEASDRSAEYRAAKKTLNRAIKDSKARCWRELCDEANRDPWGQAYKLITRRIRSPVAQGTLDAATTERVVDGLFLNNPARDFYSEPGDRDVVPTFILEELQSVVGSLKPRKAPGPDGIPAEALKMVARLHPDLLLKMYNTCLRGGVFPSPWKDARLVLISKGKGASDSPSSYQPVCMLNTAGKVMEKMLKTRLLRAVQAAGDLSDRQHGFRRGHSTISAISDVVEAVGRAYEASHRTRPLVLLVTLDGRNAFNSARWIDMLRALE
ncbi:uncharacterized protein LOC128874492 [Hylaeus volcanicus]|uniref:uncharacterized protein LOC128874492 n=1 Tax=Hylaeus volcanicus TaxID=313075 RepID=UPI0023B7F386|nr:uncharacterized protein LOC128874492 [Hylaeus volcanicus]